MILRQHFSEELLAIVNYQDAPIKQGSTISVGSKRYLVHRVVVYAEDITPSGGCSGASGFARTYEQNAERRGQHKDE